MKMNKTAFKYYGIWFLICIGATSILSSMLYVFHGFNANSPNAVVFEIICIICILGSILLISGLYSALAELSTKTAFVTERLKMESAIGSDSFYVYWAYIGKRLTQDRIYVHNKFPYYLETHRKVEGKYSTPLMIDIETYEERENRISTLFTGIPVN